jgi:hypothetical protein
VYDERQHLELFHGPGHYLFRGTLPSGAFTAPYQGVGVSPATIDLIVATLFACRYRMEGPAIVLIALKSAFTELLDGPNLSSFYYELAVNIELPAVQELETYGKKVSVLPPNTTGVLRCIGSSVDLVPGGWILTDQCIGSRVE